MSFRSRKTRRRGRKIALDPVASKHMEAQMDYDYHAFKNNPGLDAFTRLPFPCELPDDIAQSYASEGLELAGVMVINVRPGLRMRKFFFRPIRRTGGKPC